VAIGSSPEIGSVFRVFGQMTREEKDKWFNWLRNAPSVGTIVERNQIIIKENDEH
jgi:hypothetical protein